MKLFARHALLPRGWADDVELSIDARGAIDSIRIGAGGAGCEALAGALVPGMPNLHSHAFQRALAGRTGRASGGSDSFWTWREAMYGFLRRIDADAFEAISAQAYVEMAKAGYTSVAEFHYVHHDANGSPHADPAELAWRVVRASANAGIALTLLPVFYAHAGFGGEPPAEAQRRFVHGLDTFAELIARLAPLAAREDAVLGVAPHSLRAVTPEELHAVTHLVPPSAPLHIHAAEQLREVDDCLAWSGARPVEWLLDHVNADARWCIVHATHMSDDETRRLAASGAVAGLAPSTEADLGDGMFAGAEFLRAGGRFGVGSDSNTLLDPFAELRQLEWSQRLRLRARNVLNPSGELTIGTSLWLQAAAGGAQAVGRRTGAIAPGYRADLVVLDDDDLVLGTTPRDALLDVAIFGPCRSPVRDVMIGGRWIVRDRRHAGEAQIAERFRTTVAALDRG